MWIMLPFAFLSVVAHRDQPNVLIVRARAQGDARAARAYLETVVDEVEHLTPVAHTPFADYAYRFEVDRLAFGTMMLEYVTGNLRHTNFKSAVGQLDPVRARLYHDVWDVLRRGLQPPDDLTSPLSMKVDPTARTIGFPATAPRGAPVNPSRGRPRAKRRRGGKTASGRRRAG